MTLGLVGKLGCGIVAAATFLVVGAASVPFVRAQSSAADWEKAAGGEMSFDVVSVKRHPYDPASPAYYPHANFALGEDDSYKTTGGLMSTENIPVHTYILFAYKLTTDEASHMVFPKWALDEHFDIEARGPADATKDQMRLMMQSLLADRFKLAVHWEDRQVPMFSVVLAKAGKTGPQLQHSSDAPCTTIPSQGRPASPSSVTCGKAGMLYLPNGEYQVMGHHETMRQLAVDLRFEPGTSIDRPFVDGTGLLGTFDFTLVWVPETRPGRQPQQEVSGPSYVEALQDQLGLKLVSTTGPEHFLVVDHIEEPSPN